MAKGSAVQSNNPIPRLVILGVFLYFVVGCIYHTSPTSTSTIESITPHPTSTIESITPNPTSTIESITPTQEIPQTYYCANKYWPIAVGASWTYVGSLAVPSQGSDQLSSPTPITETWTITSVEGDFPFPARFMMLINNIEDSYYCDASGIYWVLGGGDRVMMLPPEDRLFPWDAPSYDKSNMVFVDRFEAVDTALGTFDALRIEYSPGEGLANYYYALYVGVVKYDAGYGFYKEVSLSSYNIP